MKRALVGFMFLMLVALSCGRVESPVAPAPDTSPLVLADEADDIRQLINGLFPPPVLRSAALLAFASIERDMEANRVSRAQRTVNGFILLSLRAFDLDLLSNPPGPMNTQQGLVTLLELLLEFVGFENVNIPPEALGEDGAVAPCGPQGCLVVTGTEFAGVQIPPGALDRNVIVVIYRLDDTNPPLNTDMDQYPLFYHFSTTPNTLFLQDVLVGLCVVDPPDPLAPDPDILDQLQLAHNMGLGIEILPLANAPFLDCAGAETEPEPPSISLPEWMPPVARLFFPPQTYLGPAARILEPAEAIADPGNLGGNASSFSPFAAVDTESGCGEFCETF